MSRPKFGMMLRLTGLAAMLGMVAFFVREVHGASCLHQGRQQVLCSTTGWPLCAGATDCAAARGGANPASNVWYLNAPFVYRQNYNPAPNNSPGTPAVCYEVYHCKLTEEGCVIDLSRKIQNHGGTAYPDVHC